MLSFMVFLYNPKTKGFIIHLLPVFVSWRMALVHSLQTWPAAGLPWTWLCSDCQWQHRFSSQSGRSPAWAFLLCSFVGDPPNSQWHQYWTRYNQITLFLPTSHCEKPLTLQITHLLASLGSSDFNFLGQVIKCSVKLDWSFQPYLLHSPTKTTSPATALWSWHKPKAHLPTINSKHWILIHLYPSGYKHWIWKPALWGTLEMYAFCTNQGKV